MTKVYGREAVEAVMDGRASELHKYADPVSGAAVLDARDPIVRECMEQDPRLLWAEVTLSVGDAVCAGRPGSEDYDEGTVQAVDGEAVTVAWSNGERTTPPALMLRRLG